MRKEYRAVFYAALALVYVAALAWLALLRPGPVAPLVVCRPDDGQDGPPPYAWIHVTPEPTGPALWCVSPGTPAP